MKLYRFSPIQNKNEMLEAIKHIHIECHKLCFNSIGAYLPNSGNIGVFCHYGDEYEKLLIIRKAITQESDNINQKYFRLYEPIVIEEVDGIPQITYTHLYIRKPDPYRHHVGDVDFFLPESEYQEFKQRLLDGDLIP
jgi:hypothetical protein